MIYKTISLEPYFNGRAASRIDSMDEGDINGVGSSLPAEQLPPGLCIFNDIPFEFPHFCDATLDNMELNNQTIMIPRDVYVKLHVIGCANNGSFQERICVSDGVKKSQFLLSLTDCYEAKPLFGETQYLRCEYTHRKDGRKMDSFKPALWYQCVDIPLSLGKVEKLLFSDNPSMHIFCLTLEQRR